MILCAVNSGLFDDIPVAKALAAEKAMRDYLKAKHGTLIDRIESNKDLTKEDEAALVEAIKAFKQSGAV